MKYNIDNMSLEVTRKCNLECRHCLRGDAEDLTISSNTISNSLKDIDTISLLTITGGEPLLAINSIEEIIKYVKDNNITISNIQLITNGSLLNKRIIKILEELSNISNLYLFISYDKFHRLEVKKKNLNKVYARNIEIYSKLFNAKKYGDFTHERVVFKSIGRAKDLNQEDINKINHLGNITNYTFTKFYNSNTSSIDEAPYIINNRVKGKVVIDVYGNLVKSNSCFLEEDESTININDTSLIESINNIDPPKILRKF